MGEPASIVTSRRLEWSETDPMGRWHYSSALRFVEHAETSLLCRLGVVDEVSGRHPRVSLTIDYLGALHHPEVAHTRLAVDQVGRSSLRYTFTISRDGVDLARGTLTAAWFDPETGRAAPWPDHLRKAFTEGGPLNGED